MIQAGTTTHLKLTNGEEIIATVIEVAGGFMQLVNAMSLTYTISPELEAKFALQPWFTMIENENEIISLHVAQIAAFTTPNENFLAEYTEASKSMNVTGLKRKQYYDEAKETTDKLRSKLRKTEREQTKTGTIFKFPTLDDDDTCH